MKTSDTLGSALSFPFLLQKKLSCNCVAFKGFIWVGVLSLLVGWLEFFVGEEGICKPKCCMSYNNAFMNESHAKINHVCI